MSRQNLSGAATLARRVQLTCDVRQDASDPRSHPAARALGRPRRGLTLAQARQCMAPYDPLRAVASRGRTKGSHLASSQGQVGPFSFLYERRAALNFLLDDCAATTRTHVFALVVRASS